MARVTLKTIADESGLSKFAVSRALAGKSGVSEATRGRVVEIAARLGYRRPALETKPLAVVFDADDIINSELHMQVQTGIQREAQRIGFGVRFHWIRHGDDLEAMAEASAGLAIVGPYDPASLRLVYATGTPVVRLGWLDPLEPVDQVTGTDHEAGTAVARYLTGLGHRRIVYVHGETRYRGRMERLYGLREVLDTMADVRLHDMTWDDDRGFGRALDELLDRAEKPTAYFCAHDGLAVTVISELLSRGLRIPEDASVIGFGDFSAALQILPRLTTVKVMGVGMGMMTVRLLDARINAPLPPTFPLRIHVASHIVERQSAGPAPVRPGLP